MTPIINLIEVLRAPGQKYQWLIVMHYSPEQTPGVYGSYRVKARAVSKARALANRTAEWQGSHLPLELQIKDKKGRIQRKDSYGTDPREIKG